MAEIINPLNKINTTEDAKKAAQNVIETARVKTTARRFELEKALKQIAELSPNDGGFEEIAVLLALPDESFSLLAPIFLKELEKNYHNVLFQDYMQ